MLGGRSVGQGLPPDLCSSMAGVSDEDGGKRATDEDGGNEVGGDMVGDAIVLEKVGYAV